MPNKIARTFNGKQFRFETFARTKNVAQSIKSVLIRDGYFVRVVDIGDGYSIYSSKGRR